VRRALAIAAALWLPVAARALPAQTAEELVTQGIAAYNALEYDAAAALLRRGLGTAGPDALPYDTRAPILVYLGATEVFRGQRDSASSAFRQALRTDPRHRPDPLVFPPAVANAFDAVRRTTAYVRVSVPPDTSIVLGSELYAARLDASALHNITVDLMRWDSVLVRRLYSGPIADSLTVRWEGLNEAGRAAYEGQLILQVASQNPAGGGRRVQIPLTTVGRPRDSLLLPLPPADSLFLPEREPKGPARRALGAGILTGLAAIVLPALLADEGGSASTRYLVAGAATTAGILGFVAARPGRPIPDNMLANQLIRDAWRREYDAAIAENERRRSESVLLITAGPATAEELR
jgi:tetratricopeptide (TPR) repeat protein